MKYLFEFQIVNYFNQIDFYSEAFNFFTIICFTYAYMLYSRFIMGSFALLCHSGFISSFAIDGILVARCMNTDMIVHRVV